MKKMNNISLRDTLENLPTQRLDEMLRAELEKDVLDEDAVRLILKALRKQESDYPVETSAQIRRALEEYEQKTTPRGTETRDLFFKVAIVLIIVGTLICILPQEAKAGSIFERIVSWTDSIFELFNPSDNSTQKEYVFLTDHPGLQELYDTVMEQGITPPIVPMWIEEEYELTKCKVTETPVVTRITSTFITSDKVLTFEVNIYSQNISREYHKNEANIERYEVNGVFHNIFQNNGLWTVVWTRGNVECSIFTDCQEDTLYKILNSIYTAEE